MMSKQVLSCYKAAVKKNIDLFDMNPAAMAGYYMHNYPGNPEAAVNYDVENLIIPFLKGNAAKQFIKGCSKEEDEECL
jgi:hypothetical protein